MTEPAQKKNPVLEENEPAKGGIEQPAKKPFPSGDSPKPHGDPLRNDLKTEK